VETIGSKQSYALTWCMPNNDDDDDVFQEALQAELDALKPQLDSLKQQEEKLSYEVHHYKSVLSDTVCQSSILYQQLCL